MTDQKQTLEELFADLEFIRSFCPRFVPCYVKRDGGKNKHTKTPAIPGWTCVTPQQSQALLTQKQFIGHRFFIFLTGEETQLFVFDIDRKDDSRVDHQCKIDGVVGFEALCGSVNQADTFTARSIGGGYHKVYKVTDELAKYLISGQPVDNVLCEILYNKRGFMFGEGCQVMHRMLPQPPPQAVVNLIINNYISNTQVNIGAINHTTIQQRETPSSETINALLNYDFSWKITQENSNSYMLVPDTYKCCVDTVAIHTQKGHSCMYVHKNSVVLTCFSHGKRLLDGDISRRIRALFFDLPSARSQGVMDMVEAILAWAAQEHLARDKGVVLKRIRASIPVYERLDTYEHFLTSRLATYDQLKAFPRRFNDLLVYMSRVDNPAFPFISKNTTYIGFANGMLNLVSGELEDYENLPHGVSPRHYIDQPCLFDGLDTPLFDHIFRFQLDTGNTVDTDTVYAYLLGLIGRLFYEVGRFDTFDVMPFVVGDTNTGKSTLVDIVSAMFAPGRVGVVDSSHETIFGLQSMHDKELIVCPEMPDNMAQHLSSDKFKKMICGEMVAVPIKHASADNVRWTVPMLMCGNDYPRYRDERGSISKRLAIFSFTRYVPVQDSSLKQQILQEELSRLVVKCLLAYRRLLQHTGTAGFWSACPDYFKQNISSMHETTDYVHMFLTLGYGDNVWFDKYTGCKKAVYFVQKQGHTMWMEDFKKKLYAYMRFKHPQVKYRWTKDYSTFKRLGYVVDRRHMCRACKQAATKGCCENYSGANRSHIDIILNIDCVEEHLERDECE